MSPFASAGARTAGSRTARAGVRTAATVLAGAVVLVGPAAVGSPGSVGIASASAEPCPNVEVVFARGTDEPPGVGSVGQAFISSLQSQLHGMTFSVYPVNYPANRFFPAAADGANDASARVLTMASSCPDTRLVLGGYSQGAAVIDMITGVPVSGIFGSAPPLPPDVADNVAAVAVFGNPTAKFGTPLTGFSPLYGYKAIDLCVPKDPICSGGLDRKAHRQYVISGMTGQAARFVAGRV